MGPLIPQLWASCLAVLADQANKKASYTLSGGAFQSSTIPGPGGHPDLCSLAHRRPQGPPGQLCQPWPPRSNSLSSLSASAAFQAHMYPEGRAGERPQTRMETLGGWDLPLHSTYRLYQCPVHSEQEPLPAVPGNTHEPILQIWNRAGETLERQPCRTQPWPPQTATALWLARAGKAGGGREPVGESKNRVGAAHLHILQHQPFQPLSDDPVDHVSQVCSFLRVTERR